MDPVHVCSCGRTYSQVEWVALPLVGYHQDKVENESLEFRNCPCGSTRSIVFAPSAETPYLDLETGRWVATPM
jgi:hypothetical protein